MMQHFGGAYELVFASDLPLPELPKAGATTAPDVVITLGSVPEQLVNPAAHGALYEATQTQFLLTVPDVGRYLVTNGDEVCIEPVGGVSEHELRVFLLGSCMGALLHQRGVLVLHASGIAGPAGAMLFAGASGAGKSTLLGELLRRGHQMIVDDVCAVAKRSNGALEVLPAYPRTRLWADAAAHLDIDSTGLVRTRSSLQKFERQIPDAFWNQAASLECLYLLGQANHNDVAIEHLQPVPAMQGILKSTYRKKYLDAFGLRAEHFALASAAVASVKVASVTRPIEGFSVVALADAIEADFAGR